MDLALTVAKDEQDPIYVKVTNSSSEARMLLSDTEVGTFMPHLAAGKMNARDSSVMSTFKCL